MLLLGRRTRSGSGATAPRPLLLLLLLAVAMGFGCGVTFSEEGDETEIFKDLSLRGEFVPDGLLQLTLEYEQPYPTEVDLSCEVLTAERPTDLPEPTAEDEVEPTATFVSIPPIEPTPRARVVVFNLPPLAPNEDGGSIDEVTPVAGTLTERFTAPREPGEYQLRCYTPRDENNQIFERFSVSSD